MKRLSVRQLVYVSLLVVVVAPTKAFSDQPSADNLTGTWQWTSYLLDPTVNAPPASAKELGTSTASVWATGTLEVKETPMAGEVNTIKGTLTFPSGLKLDVRGRRVTGEGDVTEFVFHGTGERPPLSTAEGTSPVKMSYRIRGTVSTSWPRGTDELNIRGYIHNITGDPWAPKAVGAFVMKPKAPGT